MWPEIEAVKKENKRELTISGEVLSERLTKNDGRLDSALYEQKQLNFLQITGSNKFYKLFPEIAKLENLQTLLLFGNVINSIPDSVGLLTKLKVLDLSKNELTEFKLDCTTMEHLATINVSDNKLTSFQLKSASIHNLDVSSNQLITWPEIPSSVTDLKMNKNQLKEIPEDLQLPNMKILDLSDNQITAIPKKFGSLKLKVFSMKGNPLKDKRLFKYIEQNQALKAIMDHISKFGASDAPSISKKNAEKPKENEQEQEKVNKIIINKFDEDFRIIYDPSVKNIRGFILACIIQNCNFTSSKMKEFLQAQTKLHDGLCKKREAATIATHDLDMILSKSLKYASKNKNDINIQPLGRHKTITADEYYNKLIAEAEAIRKEKKRSQFTGVYKFLHLLDGQESFAYLETESGTCLSLPPMTNSENTKITTDTKSILVEVTSSSNAAICYQVMAELLAKTFELNISGSEDDNEKFLELKQVRILNVEGSLKTVYPSKPDLIDLENEKTKIIRP